MNELEITEFAISALTRSVTDEFKLMEQKFLIFEISPRVPTSTVQFHLSEVCSLDDNENRPQYLKQMKRMPTEPMSTLHCLLFDVGITVRNNNWID